MNFIKKSKDKKPQKITFFDNRILRMITVDDHDYVTCDPGKALVYRFQQAPKSSEPTRQILESL